MGKGEGMRILLFFTLLLLGCLLVGAAAALLASAIYSVAPAYLDVGFLAIVILCLMGLGARRMGWHV